MPESRNLSDRRRLEELFMNKSLLKLGGLMFIGACAPPPAPNGGAVVARIDDTVLYASMPELFSISA